MKNFEEKVVALKDKLISLIKMQAGRTETGMKLRTEMAEQLARGEQPEGYRYDFLRQSALRIVEELGEIAKEFDDKYPQDRCTNYDFVDILNTAIELIRRASGSK